MTQKAELNGQVYYAYIPFAKRYFRVDKQGKIHEYAEEVDQSNRARRKRKIRASISHRVAQMHGLRKVEWENEKNRRF